MKRPAPGPDDRGQGVRRFPPGGPHGGKSDGVAAGPAAQVSRLGFGRFAVERRVHCGLLSPMPAGSHRRGEFTGSSHRLTGVSHRFLPAAPSRAYSQAKLCLCRLGGRAAVIDYRLLGPIEADLNGRALDVGGPKQRALLAILLLSANVPVSRDVLVDRLWGEHPPAGAQHTLEVYVSRLRKALEPTAEGPVVLAVQAPTCCVPRRSVSTSAVSSAWPRRAVAPSRIARLTGQRRTSVRRWRSGAVRPCPM